MKNEYVEQYIEHALLIQEANHQEISATALRELATEIGLTDQDIAGVQRNVENRAERARGFMRHKLWDEAIDSWEFVTALSPANVGYLEAFGRALSARNAEGDLIRAKELVDRILDLDPKNEFAFALIKRGKGRETEINWPSTTNVFASLVIVIALTVINSVIIPAAWFTGVIAVVAALLFAVGIIQSARPDIDTKQIEHRPSRQF